MHSDYPVLIPSDIRWSLNEIDIIGSLKKVTLEGISVNQGISSSAQMQQNEEMLQWGNLLWCINDWRSSHVAGADWRIKASARELWLWRICVLKQHDQRVWTSRLFMSEQQWKWVWRKVERAAPSEDTGCENTGWMWRSSTEPTPFFLCGGCDVDNIFIKLTFSFLS